MTTIADFIRANVYRPDSDELDRITDECIGMIVGKPKCYQLVHAVDKAEFFKQLSHYVDTTGLEYADLFPIVSVTRRDNVSGPDTYEVDVVNSNVVPFRISEACVEDVYRSIHNSLSEFAEWIYERAMNSIHARPDVSLEKRLSMRHTELKEARDKMEYYARIVNSLKDEIQEIEEYLDVSLDK